MNDREIIELSFDSKIRETFKDRPELRDFLLVHERKSMCIENMVREINKAELSHRITLDRKRLGDIAESFALTFSKLALKKAEEDSISKIERSRRIREEDENIEFAKMFDEEVDISDD